MLTIWILWGSWRTGIALRKTCLAAWYHVLSLVRTPQKFISLGGHDVYIQWSATHINDVERLLQQVDVVIDATSVGFFHHKPAMLYSNVAQTVIAAWNQWKATQFIVMSSAGTDHWRRLPRPANRWYELFLGDVANDKEKAEALLAASSLPWTIIKSPLLTNGPASPFKTQEFETYTPKLYHTISRNTVARCVTDILWNSKYIHKKIVPLSL